MRRNVFTNTAVENGKNAAGYKIGKTTYVVNSFFKNGASRDVSKVLERLAIRDAEKISVLSQIN